MSSMLRQIKRAEEKKKLNEIRYTYGKKPKGICPKCKKHSLFMTNSKNEVYCIRCNECIKIN